MPTRPTYPGVYIEEIPSGVRTVTGVATSTAAFIGTFERGLHNEAVRLLSQADFEREFGGQERNSEASYAVQQFFLNGGSEAYVVRIGHDGSGTDNTAISASTIDLLDGDGAPLITVTAGRRIRGQSATNPGRWGNNLRIVATHNGTAANSTFNLVVSELRIQGTTASVVTSEAFNNLTTEPNTANNVIDVVNQGSRLVQLTMAVAVTDPFPLPAATGMVSGELAAARPAFGNLDDISVTVAGFGAAAQALTIAPDVPANPSQAVRETQAAFTSWAQQPAGRDPGRRLTLRTGTAAVFRRRLCQRHRQRNHWQSPPAGGHARFRLARVRRRHGIRLQRCRRRQLQARTRDRDTQPPRSIWTRRRRLRS